MKQHIFLSSPHMSEEGYEKFYIEDAFQKNFIAPLGENVTEFEKELGEKIGARQGAALSSGTSAIQLALTELNENLLEIYIEAYSQKEASEYIMRQTAKELYQIFGEYLPELNEDDFYVLEIGSAGLMRGYMAQPCDEAFTLEKKLGGFLTLSLRGYNVPKEQVEQALAFVQGLDIRTIACRIMQELFRALAMRYDFSPQGLLKETEIN